MAVKKKTVKKTTRKPQKKKAAKKSPQKAVSKKAPKKSVSKKKAVKKKTVKKKVVKKKTVKKKVVKKKAVKKTVKKAVKKAPKKAASQKPAAKKKVAAKKASVPKVPVKKVRKEREPGETSMALGLTPMRIYLNQIEHIPLLTPQEELDLSKKIQTKATGWKQAREKMIKSNLRLVINIAKRYANMGLPFSDLVEEGNIGLMRAVAKFNYKKGYRFSTYASWWIKQGMMRALSNQSKLIRIPVHMYESITKWRKAREVHIQRFGKIPTQKELAKQMDVPVEKVREIESVLNNPGSLNAPLSLDSANELIDVIEDSNADQPYESSHEHFRSQKIKELLEQVNDRERRILILRFGLYGEESRTLEYIAQEFGVTRERVRQIEEAALKKIRMQAESEENSLHDYI